ncbi:hypothetical protein D3C78_1725560 [compost metagenome]
MSAFDGIFATEFADTVCSVCIQLLFTAPFLDRLAVNHKPPTRPVNARKAASSNQGLSLNAEAFSIKGPG